MLKKLGLTVVVILYSVCAAAQQPAKPAAQKQAPAEKAAPAKPELPPNPVNVLIEVTITDQVGSGAAAKKVVSMIAGDGQRNSIRSSASVMVKSGLVPQAPGGAPVPTSYIYRNVTINVDARPRVLAARKIFLEFGLEYQPKSAGGAEDLEPGMSSLTERMNVVAESGTPIILSQAADPTSDRRITVSLTATIQK